MSIVVLSWRNCYGYGIHGILLGIQAICYLHQHLT